MSGKTLKAMDDGSVGSMIGKGFGSISGCGSETGAFAMECGCAIKAPATPRRVHYNDSSRHELK